MIFAYPFLLLALLGLPLAYRWMRALPGGEVLVPFAAMMFLGPARGPVQTVKKIPLWLILLRLTLLALLILWAAGPHRSVEAEATPRPTLILIDTSWSADLPGTLSDITTFFDRHPDADVQVMTTDQDTPIPMTSARWGAYQRTMTLAPYQATDTASVLEKRTDQRSIMYYAPMRYGPQQQGIVNVLRQLPQSTVVLPARTSCAALSEVKETPTGLQAILNNQCKTPVRGVLYDASTRQNLAEATTIGNTLAFPPVTQNASARVIALEGEDHFAGRWLLPSLGSGAVAVVHAASRPQGLLEEATYITKALETSGRSVLLGPVAAFQDKEIATWILPDATALDAETASVLRDKVNAGARLIRFWGPRLDALPPDQRDDLFPENPRFRARQLGTTLAWQGALKSQPLHPPLRGDGGDVMLLRHILPESETATTLAQLSDQTPWITAQALGKGQIVLIHTGLMPEWGNLATSRTFVPLLASLAAFSGASGGDFSPQTADLPLWQKLQPDGSLERDMGATLRFNNETARPTVDHPAGFYGSEGSLTPHNIAPFLAKDPPTDSVLRPGDPTLTVRKSQSIGLSGDLRPWVFAGIVALFILELLAVVMLRFRRPGVAVAALLMVFLGLPAQARDVQIGYVLTGQAALDQASAKGLQVLIQETLTRTNMPMDPRPVPLSLTAALSDWTPVMMVYWPLTGTVAMDEGLAQRLRSYTAGDGLLVLDTRGGDNSLHYQTQVVSLQPLARVLGLTPLRPIAENHVVHHSYYILPKLGGLWPGLNALAAAPQGTEDPVFSLIVLGTDLAGGLLSADGAVRETSIRTGINLMMYAATTTYKDDQIHIDAMMKRLRP